MHPGGPETASEDVASPPIGDDHLRLLLASGIGPGLHARLEAVFGAAERAVRASTAELAAIEGIGSRRAAEMRRAIDAVDPGRERAELERIGARIVTRRDARYPRLLATIPDPPPALWVRGDVRTLAVPGIAVVGSRRCTLYGREQASKLAAGLAECGFVVISGGARGIDAAAHHAALRTRGATIAVLGCGLGHCYPPEHAELFEEIAGSGLLLSELPTGFPPRAEGFPRRNRLISGLSLGVVVVEAALRSGALITAREATESHHREVMAIPGPVDSRTSAGCHRAIREGWAGLVTGLTDVLEQLTTAGLLVQGANEASAQPRPVDGVRKAILDALSATSDQDAASLATRLAVPVDRVLAAITLLQLEGLAVRGRSGFRRGTGNGDGRMGARQWGPG